MEKSLCRPPLCHDLRLRRAEGHSVSESMAPSGRLLLRARCRGSAPALARASPKHPPLRFPKPLCPSPLGISGIQLLLQSPS